METKIIGIRLKDSEKKALQAEAKRNGLSLADYIRYLSRLKVDLKMTIKNLRAEK